MKNTETRWAWDTVILILVALAVGLCYEANAGELTKPADRIRQITGYQGVVGGIVSVEESAEQIIVHAMYHPYCGSFEFECIGVAPTVPLGVCDTDKECREACETACDNAGHGDKVKDADADGDSCTAKCDDGSGAWCVWSCSPPPEIASPNTIIDECDPVGNVNCKCIVRNGRSVCIVDDPEPTGDESPLRMFDED